MVTPRASQARFVRSPQPRLGVGQLRPVVHAARLGGIAGHDADDLVAGVGQHLDDVGEVVLALRVVGVDEAQRRREEAAPEAEDRRC